MKQYVVFSDLDGTLLDYYSYSFEEALPALSLLREKHLPLVICSSKTRSEIEYYRGKLDNRHPFVSENGGGIFIPKGYFDFSFQDIRDEIIEENSYTVVSLGAGYPDLRGALRTLRAKGFQVRGFGDMTIEEVSALAGMTFREAEMAKERDFDEPFLFKGGESEVQRLIAEIRGLGFTFTRGRFFHILGNSDKGKAVSILSSLYKMKFGEITTLALGDSPNDTPMLERVDVPVLVQKPDGTYSRETDIPGLIRADGIGPAGWNKEVLRLLSATGI